MSVVPSDPLVRSASTARGPFTYTDEGRGPCLVAIHGLPGSTRDFRHLGAVLERSARLVRLDLPGFGGTPVASGAGVSLGERAHFVDDALAALALREVTLIGHSMGGGVAMVAASAPRVKSVALIASIGLRPHHLLRRAVGRALMVRLLDGPLKPLTRRLVHRVFRAMGFSAATPLEEVAQTFRCLERLDFGIINAAVEALQKPALTAFADDDPFIEPEISLELAARLPQGPRLRWPTGGHNIQKTHAEELGAQMLRWVSDAQV